METFLLLCEHHSPHQEKYTLEELRTPKIGLGCGYSDEATRDGILGHQFNKRLDSFVPCDLCTVPSTDGF
jgi:hypothetical protein